MDEGRGHFRLGFFVVVSLTTLVAILLALGGRSLFQPRFVFETYFDGSVAGLEIGAPVQFRGVPLGQISAIAGSGAIYEQDVPVDKRKGYIVVEAKVSGDPDQVEQWREELSAYIKRGLRAQTQLAGVTGQQYLSLDFFDPGKHPPLEIPWTPRHPYVPSAPSLAGQIIGKLQKLMASLDEADIQALGKNLNTLVETLNAKLAALPVADLSVEITAVLKEARAMLARLDGALAETSIDEAVGNIASASARLDALLAAPGLEQTIEHSAALTGRLRGLVESGSLDRIVDDLEQTIQRIDALVGDNQYDVRVMVRGLRETADNLRVLSESAKRYPAGVIFGGPPEKVDLPWNQ
ncbi:MCE family protein [Thiorhodococcus mannitoliphagus]|uniref:MCE family protein n=1 Tax=Thiorhodococcus mannitoliphagus TaxID=329406 RepID=A0A6P1DRT0_9GAMM|nr:MlaD family protein [Thiorhodococcus mannitoliphagus]NEX19631.1 MCE family protein [Thiorhodococcus mannitoliphagus]